MDEELRAHQVDIDPDFEPQSRPRAGTWPLPHPDFPGEEDDGAAAAAGAGGGIGGGGGVGSKHPLTGGPEGAENAGVAAERGKGAPALPSLGADVGQLRKAKTSRRNAWGNLSYADLITKAIESSPEKRLTLSQIYDWMVRYVPYFKDKGDSNSSAGWKVGRNWIDLVYVRERASMFEGPEFPCNATWKTAERSLEGHLELRLLKKLQ